MLRLVFSQPILTIAVTKKASEPIWPPQSISLDSSFNRKDTLEHQLQDTDFGYGYSGPFPTCLTEQAQMHNSNGNYKFYLLSRKFWYSKLIIITSAQFNTSNTHPPTHLTVDRTHKRNHLKSLNNGIFYGRCVCVGGVVRAGVRVDGGWMGEWGGGSMGYHPMVDGTQCKKIQLKWLKNGRVI